MINWKLDVEVASSVEEDSDMKNRLIVLSLAEENGYKHREHESSKPMTR